MTPEEFELEAYAVRHYHEYLDELKQEEENAWISDAQRKVAEIATKEAAQRKKDMEIRRAREAAASATT